MVTDQSFSELLRENAGELYVDEPLEERWTIGARVGAGGIGAVHIANRVRDRQIAAAVKVIAKTLIRNNIQRVRLLLSEVRCIQLAHEEPQHLNIVTVYEVCEDSENVYIVQEYINGGELFALLASRGSPFHERDCAVMMRALLSAVEFLHERGIAHRDIKPENVMFPRGSDVGRAKLIDFGVSFHESQANLLNRIPIGSPMYLAPEVMHNCEYTFAADVWSLGIVAFVCLTFMLPYDLSLSSDSLLDIALEFGPCFDIAEFRALSPEARDFVHSALKSNPSRRPSVRELLQHPWIARYARTITVSAAHETKFRAHIAPVVALRGSRASSVTSEIYRSPPRVPPPELTPVSQSSAAVCAAVRDSSSVTSESASTGKVPPPPPAAVVVEELHLNPPMTPAAVPLKNDEQMRTLAAILDLEDESDSGIDSLDGEVSVDPPVSQQNSPGRNGTVAFPLSGPPAMNPVILKRLGSNTNLWSTKNMLESRFDLCTLLQPASHSGEQERARLKGRDCGKTEEELCVPTEAVGELESDDAAMLCAPKRKISDGMSGMLSRVLSIDRAALQFEGGAAVES
eukprot:CAMPEP_0185856412 /NCGR_PEP_ID=MMETSP1354-20130828/28956_1 /TAXON_ID=708628 /ORGANISM="Erythrolobus madagascarensis, Strain CCMP3276" /LENGTH=571 /DNA_ID=CAMNT_0028558657 /DNA_START=109 /DNA_END=1824 /DNA_ORIENTATION=-